MSPRPRSPSLPSGGPHHVDIRQDPGTGDVDDGRSTMTAGEPQSIGGWTDGEPYNGACKDVRYPPLRSSRLRDVSFDVPSAAFVCLIGVRLCRGQTACRGCSHSASLCVSCLAPTPGVAETLSYGYRDHRRYRQHKRHHSECEIRVYVALRIDASVQLGLMDPGLCLAVATSASMSVPPPYGTHPVAWLSY